MEPPAGFRYFDAHTHLHPPRLFAAIRRWFDEHSDWELRGPTEPDAVVAALRAAGVERFAFFTYAHRPGMARELNRWIRDTAARFPDGVPLGTVHAGDDDPAALVDEACGAWGLAGLKLHTQVQRFHPDDPRLWPVYARLVELDRVLVIHVGTGPHTNEFTGLARFERVLQRFPTLRASICHMGAFETRAALQLLDRFPNLHLDTTMAMTQRVASVHRDRPRGRAGRGPGPIRRSHPVRQRLPDPAVPLRGGAARSLGARSSARRLPADLPRQRPGVLPPAAFARAPGSRVAMAVRAIKAPGLWTSDLLAKPLDEGALLAAIDQAVARSHLCPGTGGRGTSAPGATEQRPAEPGRPRRLSARRPRVPADPPAEPGPRPPFPVVAGVRSASGGRGRRGSRRRGGSARGSAGRAWPPGTGSSTARRAGTRGRRPGCCRGSASEGPRPARRS